MIFLELDWAIFKRLTGVPLDSTGRPLLDDKGIPKNLERIGPPDLNDSEREWDETRQDFVPRLPLLPSYGIRIPVMKAASRGQQGLTSFAPSALPIFAGFEPNAFKQIPIFDENVSGRKFEDTWPCVSFRWLTTDFDPSVFVYHDPFGGPDPLSLPKQIRNSQGEVIQTGQEYNLARPHPESWPADYALTVRAKNGIELRLICDALTTLFPARGGINVEFASGELHTCDMFLLRTENLDEGGVEGAQMTRGAEEQRGLIRSFVYRIEAYKDNTTNQFGSNDTRRELAIVERILELERVQSDRVTKESELDLNLGELEPITG